MKNLTTSRKTAIFIIISTVALTGICAFKGLEGLGAAVWTSGIIAGPGLYANKQYQERKTLEKVNASNISNNEL